MTAGVNAETRENARAAAVQRGIAARAQSAGRHRGTQRRRQAVQIADAAETARTPGSANRRCFVQIAGPRRSARDPRREGENARRKRGRQRAQEIRGVSIHGGYTHSAEAGAAQRRAQARTYARAHTRAYAHTRARAGTKRRRSDGRHDVERGARKSGVCFKEMWARVREKRISKTSKSEIRKSEFQNSGFAAFAAHFPSHSLFHRHTAFGLPATHSFSVNLHSTAS